MTHDDKIKVLEDENLALKKGIKEAREDIMEMLKKASPGYAYYVRVESGDLVTIRTKLGKVLEGK